VIDFQKILGSLSRHGVDFILVGGVAAIAHGASRLTEDLDIVYSRTDKNLDRLVSALSPFSPYLRGAPPGLPFRWDAQTLRRGLNFTLTTTAGAIDALGEIVGGGGFDQLLPHSVEITIFSTTCRCLNLQKLIEVKRAVGRPKDLDAVAELEALTDETRAEGDDSDAPA
jgi:hypothetical protein